MRMRTSGRYLHNRVHSIILGIPLTDLSTPVREHYSWGGAGRAASPRLNPTAQEHDRRNMGPVHTIMEDVLAFPERIT